jgi:hypothetical protein
MPKDSFVIRLDLDNAPDIAVELGNMCVAWAAIEFRLFATYLLVTRLPVPLARATFYSHYNARNRINLLKATAGMVLGTISEQRELDTLLGKIGNTSQARNKYIHDPWGAWKKKPEAVFQIRLSGAGLTGEGTPVQKNHLTSLIKQMHEQHLALYRLGERLKPLLPPFQRKLARTRLLALAFSRRQLPRKVRRARRPRRPRQSPA